MLVQWLTVCMPGQSAADMNLIPGPVDPTCLGAPQLLSPCSRAQEVQILEPKHSRACALQQEMPPQRETHAPQLESSPSLPQLEKAQEQQQRPSATKNKYIF